MVGGTGEELCSRNLVAGERRRERRGEEVGRGRERYIYRERERERESSLVAIESLIIGAWSFFIWEEH